MGVFKHMVQLFKYLEEHAVGFTILMTFVAVLVGLYFGLS